MKAIDYCGLSPRAFHAAQNLGLEVRVRNNRKAKAIMRKYVNNGTLFIVRHCGIKTHNEIRIWLGMKPLEKTGYRTKELKFLLARNLSREHEGHRYTPR